MSPGRDLGRRDDDGSDMDEFGDSDQRSIFSALWFRALLAVLILGILAAVAVPYLLDYATSPSAKTAAKPPAAAPPAPAADPAAPTASPAPAATTAAPSAPAAATPATAVPAPSPPAQETAKPKVAPAPAAKPVAKAAKAAEMQTKATKVAEAPTKTTKVAEAQTKAAKVAEAPKPAPKAAATKSSPTKPATLAPTGGPYWVQVGAFKDAETAKRLVARLREQGLPAAASTVNSAAPQRPAEPAVEGSAADRYDIVVSGASPAEVDGKLAAKGLTGETTPNGIVVRPSLALREAVALSRELADAGLSVQVRRVGGPVPAAAAAPAPAPAPAAAATLHRVRVGGFPDRATAASAAKQLEEKGFKPFIARGNE